MLGILQAEDDLLLAYLQYLVSIATYLNPTDSNHVVVHSNLFNTTAEMFSTLCSRSYRKTLK